MRSLSVQIQPERAPSLDVAAVTSVFSTIANDPQLVRHHAFDSGRDSGAYHNFTFGTERAGDLWREVRRRLFEDPVLGVEMRKVSIATCSSETGWNDYVLLFHFDPATKVDSAADLD